MNELSKLFLDIKDGENIVFEKNKIYDVSEEDSFELTGFYCSNTAKQNENSNGLRRSAIFLNNKRDIVIDGNGATVLVHGKMTPFLLNECENIKIKNLTVDYACPTMSEFKVEKNENGTCILKINPECLFRIEDNALIFQGENSSNGQPYWQGDITKQGRYTRLLNPEDELYRDFRREDLVFETLEYIDEYTLKGTLENKEVYLPTGSIIQTRSIVRDQTGALFQRCKNLEFENLRVMFMHGLGMVSQFCENICYKNCDFTPKTGRTISSTADFFQFSGCKGKIIIENCKACGAHDDYINVHGTHLQIIEKNNEEKSIVVRFMHPESWGFQAFNKGDRIDFIKWDTLIPFYSATVLNFNRLNDTEIKLYLDLSLPGIELQKDVVENASCTPNLFVRNNTFGPTSGRGILCTTRGEVIIENNTFTKVCGPALLIEDDCNFWFESGYTKKVIFRNNTVDFCDYLVPAENSSVIRCTPKVMAENSTEFVHKKLIVENNIFKNAPYGKHKIWLEYIREAEIINNTFDAEYEVYEKTVGSVKAINNIIL